MHNIISYNGVDNMDKCFGGISIILGGDFRIFLSVIRKASRQDTLAVSINSSNLCNQCKVLTLIINTSLRSSTNQTQQIIFKKLDECILSTRDEIGSANESGEIKLCITDKFSIEDPILKVAHLKVPGQSLIIMYFFNSA